MLETCTCGAKLPPDALFCHKCGKPQREFGPEVVEEPVETPPSTPEPAAVPPPPPPAAFLISPGQLPLDFRNPVAVRIALLMATASTVLIWIPFVNFAIAGFGTTYFYRRRTGVSLNVAAGARLGWITGVMMFVISIIVFCLKTVSDGGLDKQFAAPFRAMGAGADPAIQQMLQFLQTPAGIAAMLLGTLFFMFVCITGLSMAGGALGARLLGRAER